jgi:hypothetical protein
MPAVSMYCTIASFPRADCVLGPNDCHFTAHCSRRPCCQREHITAPRFAALLASSCVFLTSRIGCVCPAPSFLLARPSPRGSVFLTRGSFSLNLVQVHVHAARSLRSFLRLLAVHSPCVALMHISNHRSFDVASFSLRRHAALVRLPLCGSLHLPSLYSPSLCWPSLCSPCPYWLSPQFASRNSPESFTVARARVQRRPYVSAHGYTLSAPRRRQWQDAGRRVVERSRGE